MHFHMSSNTQKKKRSPYSLFQVRPNFHNKVECLESTLQFVTVYVGAFAIAQLALGFKLYVVYDEAMSTWAGIHFIALTHVEEKRDMMLIHNASSKLCIFCWS